MKYIFLILFSALVFGETYLTFQRNSTALVQNGLETIEPESTATNQTAYYPLYGNALDYSKNENDGTVYEAVSTGTNYWFDGVDDYIDFGNLSIFDFHNKDYTICAWIKTDKAGYIIQKAENKGYYYGWRLFINSSGVLDYLTVAPVNHLAGTTIVTNDVWHFVVVSSENSNGKLYCDNILEATATINLTDKNYPMQIGRDSEGALYFNGYLKDARIYDKAFTAEEILTIYNATK